MKKEKSDRAVTVMVQPSLYKVFEEKCVAEHRTISEVVRELMSRYAQGWVQTPRDENEKGK